MKRNKNHFAIIGHWNVGCHECQHGMVRWRYRCCCDDAMQSNRTTNVRFIFQFFFLSFRFFAFLLCALWVYWMAQVEQNHRFIFVWKWQECNDGTGYDWDGPVRLDWSLRGWYLGDAIFWFFFFYVYPLLFNIIPFYIILSVYPIFLEHWIFPGYPDVDADKPSWTRINLISLVFTDLKSRKIFLNLFQTKYPQRNPFEPINSSSSPAQQSSQKQ